MEIKTTVPEGMHEAFPFYTDPSLNFDPNYEFGRTCTTVWRAMVERQVLNDIAAEPESYEEADNTFALLPNPRTVNVQQAVQKWFDKRTVQGYPHNEDEDIEYYVAVYSALMPTFEEGGEWFTVVGMWDNIAAEGYFGFPANQPEPKLLVLFG
jgi:hypothetical protein